MLAAVLAWFGLAAAPAIPLSDTSPGAIDHARSLWLLGCLAVVTGWLATREPWLACIGAWFLWRWRVGDVPLDAKPVAALVSWAGVGVTWWAARSLPLELLGWLPWAWIALAWAHTVVMAWQHWRHGRRNHAHGWLGQRSIAAGLYVLTIPFCPWWALPGPLLGFWLTGPSWGALVALVPAVVWLLPLSWLPWAAGGLLMAVLAGRGLSRAIIRGRYAFEWTPRGDSLDSLRVRWLAVRIAWEEIRYERRWLWGEGPGTMPLTTRRWAARLRDPSWYLAKGDLHMEPVQIVYEYGVLGVAAMALFAWEVGGRMTWGDPWSSAALAGAVFACSTYALRVAPLGVLWLAIAAGVGR